MEKLRWRKDMSLREKQWAVEAARLLGFYSESAQFPVISDTEGQTIPASPEELEAVKRTVPEGPGELVRLDRKGEVKPLPEDYCSATKHPMPAENPEFRKETGLELLFSPGFFLQDTDGDFLADAMDVKLILPPDAEDDLWKAACELAFRFGMDTTGWEGSLTAEEDWQGSALVIRYGNTPRLWLESRSPARVVLEGRGEELLQFVALLCNTFPLLPENRTWQDAMMEMTDSFAMKNLDGELAALAENPEAEEAFLSPEYMEKESAYKEAFPDCSLTAYKSGKTIYEKEYQYPWEKDVLENLLEEKLYPALQPGDQVEVYGAVSEDKNIRRQIEETIAKKTEERQAVPGTVRILCAYKQGFSWLEEAVLPELAEKKAAKVHIAFAPFLPEGETEWLDENGATPSYHNLGADNPDKWYDLPIRYLQELYPIEDVLTKGLGISRDQVEFSVYEGGEKLTYHCTAEDAEGNPVYEGSCLAACSERPFLDEYPRMGKVHPSTGYVKVLVNGKTVLEEKIKTDLEQIWDTYQKEVLPDCRRYVEEKFGDNITDDAQPFFNELRLEVSVSEPEIRLESREDLISPLDALHEDMYFVGADYFKNLGIEKSGALLDAPGLILPVIHQREGAPSFRVVLSGQVRHTASVEKGGQVLAAPGSREEAETFLSGLSLRDGKLEAEITTRAETGRVKAYAGLAEKGLLERPDGFGNTAALVWKTKEGEIRALLPETEEIPKDLSIFQVDITGETLIGYDEYIHIMEQLKRVPGISVSCVARSWLGRKIYAIELLPSGEGYVSRTRRLSAYPSEIINTRHHANEVSGTTAMFLLLKKLLSEKKYEGLADRMNLVMVPMENPDGAAIHYELQKEHPFWKFHVARFSAVGKEFSREYFKKDTIHREAMAVTRLFYRYLPDIFVDNHGVPSHEWEQQFSGYTSPSYKGFWLPRSLLYGYFWYVTEEEYRSNYVLNKEMEDRIADKIAEDAEMTWWNRTWAAQFEKYAHGWMPKLFPADYYKDMINYWIPFQRTEGHHYSAVSFPWITSVSYTSEVADETAQGSYLKLCADAHVAHDEAAIEMLSGADLVLDWKEDISGDQISVHCIRQRPVIAGWRHENK